MRAMGASQIGSCQEETCCRVDRVAKYAMPFLREDLQETMLGSINLINYN